MQIHSRKVYKKAQSDMFLAPLSKSKNKNEGVITQPFQQGRKKWNEQREYSLNK